ncbi:MAG: nucleotidyl transferase AbiEii/AbiGii toxin family protein [Nitrospira sp.]|nr:nucleotidyl transferase AbiEii/AbiGii toxin family protein [Nitrospira sp.]
MSRFRTSPLREHFYLTGGTALSAFYLRHRYSEDLDFFTEQEVELESVLGFLRTIPHVVNIQHERKYDRRLFLLHYHDRRTMKVEFTKYPFLPLERHMVVEDVQVDSCRDILVNKLMALTDRKDFKDYLDVYFLLLEFPALRLWEAIQQTQAKFGVKGIDHILKGRFLEALPPQGELPMLKPAEPAAMASFYKSLARDLIARSLEEP